MQGSSTARLMTSFQKIQSHLIKKIEALPAVKAGMPLFLGALFFYEPFLSTIFLFFFLFLLNPLKTLVYFSASVCFFYYHLSSPLPEKALSTLGYVEIEESKKLKHSYLINGYLIGILDNQKMMSYNQKVSFFYPKNLTPGSYTIKADFLPSPKKGIILKNPTILSQKRNQPLWQKIKRELRQKIIEGLKTHFQYQDGENLLLGLIMGYEIKKEIKTLFSKLGLSHILAISGFHFSLIAAHFSKILSLFFRPRSQILILIFVLTFYFFYLVQALLF